MGELKQIRNVTQSNDIRFQLINRLNVWANAYGVSALSNLGDKINISKIIFCPLDIFVVNSMFETRLVSKVKEPFHGSESEVSRNGECKYFEPKDVEPFSINLQSSPMNYIKETYVSLVPNSRHIESCIECHGKGKNDCTECHTKGMVPCSYCRGLGQTKCMLCLGLGVKDCQYCYGIGLRKEERVIEQVDSRGVLQRNRYYDNVQCIYCNGVGRFQCTSCNNGSVICEKCGGQRLVKCTSCAGVGSNTCKVCSGAGKSISHLEVKQDFEVFSGTEFFVNPEILKIFPDFAISSDLEVFEGQNTHKIGQYEAREVLKMPYSINFIPEEYAIASNYSGLLEQRINKEISKMPEGYLAKQKISFYQADQYVVFYEHSGKKFALIVNSYLDEIYAPVSPFTEIANDLVKKAASFAKVKDYGKAMDLVKEADKLSFGTPFKTNTTKAIFEIAKLLTRNYNLGFVIGCGLFFLYEIISNILNFLNKPNFTYIGLICHMTIIGLLIFLQNTFQKNIVQISTKFVLKNAVFRIITGFLIAVSIIFLLTYSIDFFLK